MRALLFTILFLVSFDLHAQTPLLAPYMHLLGASAAMIGFVIGAYSVSNLAGNLIAGPFLDRFAKKWFIGCGLLLAGMIMIGQGVVGQPEPFFWLRLLLGFLMAFVSPACFAMLGESGQGAIEQGKLMAKNGMVLTSAAIVSPTVGSLFAALFGYPRSFVLFGLIMIAAGLFALLVLPTEKRKGGGSANRHRTDALPPLRTVLENGQIYPALVAGFAVLYAQGTLVYEIPLFIQKQQLSPTVTGTLFSVMALGSLAMLSQFWLQRTPPDSRTSVGLFALSLLMYGLAIGLELSIYVTMFLLGACFGLLFPAMSTMLVVHAPRELYGSVFSLFSAVLSLGAILSPMVAGLMEQWRHSFFIAFFVAIGACLIGGLHRLILNRATN
jgi:DHA1 family multidrug resistance protein-like MFS transporter